MVYSIIDILENKTEWVPKKHEKTNIYFLINKQNEVVYVGQSVDVYSRVSNHRGTKEFMYYSYFACEKEAANSLEDMYITLLDPFYNKKLNKFGMYYSLSEIAGKFNLSQYQVLNTLESMKIEPLFSSNYRTIDIDIVAQDIKEKAIREG